MDPPQTAQLEGALHELNERVAIISGKAQLRLSDPAQCPARLRRDLEMIVEQCRLLNDLTRRLAE